MSDDGACLTAEHVVIDAPHDGGPVAVVRVGFTGRRVDEGGIGRGRWSGEHGESERKGSGFEGEGDRRGWCPRVRPVGTGHREPDRVTGLEDPRGRLELERDPNRLAGDEGLGRDRRAPVTQVEESSRHEHRRAVGEHVVQLHREERHRCIGHDDDLGTSVPRDRQLTRRHRRAVPTSRRRATSRRRDVDPPPDPTAGARRTRSTRSCRRRRVRPACRCEPGPGGPAR